ncbi:hypothetical protein L873DRAFT_593617 [Choiromyces venosus 120613-1]|uniref:Uncharacterized protein n=1 Tax=Choiromyces venosus 120613-1 TaxID=1336337 RepID=A0A3N4IU83_9PEZI|nr:hypothetical protein L873DRAFT_593617 [Choiromyces venosus 120613-1]
MRPQQVAITWSVGEAWEKISTQRAEVIPQAFRVVGLSLPINRSEDHELSIKGLANNFLVVGVKEGEAGGVGSDDDETVDEEKVEG